MSAPAWPPPGAGEVHLWWIDLTLAASAREHLTDAERVRATGFRRSGDGEQWGAARGALRQILAHYTGEPPARLRLEAGPHGKPALAPAGTTDLRFNLTHTGDRELLAIAWQREVGIDLASWESGAALRGDLDALISTTCSDREAAWLRSLSAEARGRAFLRLWTAKEACLKAAGVGLHWDLRTVEALRLTALTPEPSNALTPRPRPRGYPASALGEGSVALECRCRMATRTASAPPSPVPTGEGRPGEGGFWSIYPLDVGPGWEAALAVTGPLPRIVWRHWPV